MACTFFRVACVGLNKVGFTCLITTPLFEYQPIVRTHRTFNLNLKTEIVIIPFKIPFYWFVIDWTCHQIWSVRAFNYVYAFHTICLTPRTTTIPVVPDFRCSVWWQIPFKRGWLRLHHFPKIVRGRYSLKLNNENLFHLQAEQLIDRQDTYLFVFRCSTFWSKIQTNSDRCSSSCLLKNPGIYSVKTPLVLGTLTFRKLQLSQPQVKLV